MQNLRKNFGMRLNDPPTPTLPGGPLLGPQPGKYLGQIVIEVWQPDDPARSDGLTFQAHRTDTSDIQAIDQFVHDTIGRIHGRLQRQQRLR